MSKADSGPKRTELESRVSAVGRTKVVAALFIGVAIGAGLMFVGVWRAGVDQSSESAEDRILAVVDGSPITIDDLEAEMERRGGTGNFASRESLNHLLDEMVQLDALVASARRAGYDEEFGVRKEMKHILAGRYRQAKLEPSLRGLEVSDEDVESYYLENSERFTMPVAFHAALLHFEYSATVAEDYRREIAERAARVRDEALLLPEGGHFGELAVRHSDDQASRYKGGDIGWIAEGRRDTRFDPAVVDAIFALEEPGALSPLIETPSGIYLVRLLATKPAEMRPLDEVSAAIRHQILARKTRRITEEFYTSTTDNVAIEIRRERLATVDVPKPPVADLRRQPPPVPQS